MYQMFNRAVSGEYLPYRTFDYAGVQVLSVAYDADSELHRFKKKLQKRFGGHIDNHSGWKVLLDDGTTVVYHFSDWKLYVHVVPTEADCSICTGTTTNHSACCPLGD
jgi:hypothetical protein